MSDDLREVLHDTAPEPTRPLNAARLVGRARRQKVGLRVAAGVASLVVVAGAAVGLPRLWADSGPEIVDTPPPNLVTAPIAVLERPPSPGGGAAGLADTLELDPQAAASARLARRTPGWAFLVYLDDSPAQPAGPPGPSLCLAAISDTGPEVVQACGSRQVPTRSHAPLVASGSFGTAGVAPDGIERAPQVADGEQLPDVPVVNNVFIESALPNGAALEGRSDEAFCGVAPGVDGGSASLAESDDPYGLLEQMAATAPADIADDMYLVWDYLRLHPGAIQGDTVDFSDPVEAAANRVDDHIRSACMGQPAPGEPTVAETPPACLAADSPSTARGTVLVYFGCGHGPDLVRATARAAPEGGLVDQLRFAVTQFAQGPTAGEREQGYRTVLPGQPSMLLAVDHRPEDGTVVVSFDPRIREVNNLGTAGVSLPFVDGLRATVLQFDGVDTLRLEINDECWPIDPFGKCTFEDEA